MQSLRGKLASRAIQIGGKEKEDSEKQPVVPASFSISSEFLLFARVLVQPASMAEVLIAAATVMHAGRIRNSLGLVAGHVERCEI